MSVERIDAYPFSMDGNSLNRIGIRYFLKSSESKFFSNSSWLSEQKSYGEPRQCGEEQRHYSADKGPYSQGFGLPSGRVQL